MTQKQRETLDFIRTHQAKHGFQPSIQEMADHFGCSSNNAIECRLMALEKKMLIQRPGGRSRSIVITPAGLRA